MTDVRRLLAEATPLPWTYTGLANAYLYDDPDSEFPPSPVNLALAVYAVNRLPDYLAAVEALEYLIDRAWLHGMDVSEGTELRDAIDGAKEALSRLRDEVPA